MLREVVAEPLESVPAEVGTSDLQLYPCSHRLQVPGGSAGATWAAARTAEGGHSLPVCTISDLPASIPGDKGKEAWAVTGILGPLGATCLCPGASRTLSLVAS